MTPIIKNEIIRLTEKLDFMERSSVKNPTQGKASSVFDGLKDLKNIVGKDFRAPFNKD